MPEIPNTIHAEVSSDLLLKADRLFLNSDSSVWTELLQNSRRAGAACVEIHIDELQEGLCLVTVRDNGKGVADFGKLLMLGKSGWDKDTVEREDPAGMGLFALCRSDVEVHSGNRKVTIRPACFRGESDAAIEISEHRIDGTQVRFTRASTKSALIGALDQVTEFCPVEVFLEGTPLVRHDFLEGALYREEIEGIEIGFSTEFLWGYSPYHDSNWNFYGSRIREGFQAIGGLLGHSSDGAPVALKARFNVRETSRVKLQLPDRRGIIQDEFLAAFQRKARAAGYRFFKAQAHHALSHRDWLEAKQLGVDLPEAALLLRTWHAQAQDESIGHLFGAPRLQLLENVSEVLLVDHVDNAHTLEAAFETGAAMAGKRYEVNPAFRGYAWYDNLPVVTEATIFVDDVAYDDWKTTSVGRPQKIEIEVSVQQRGIADRYCRLPALIHAEPNDWNWYEPDFVAVANSPWDNDDLEGPFSVTEFLAWAVFSYSDDSDTWDTQKARFDEEIEEQVNDYFRSPMANLLGALRHALDYRTRLAAQKLGVHEIRFKLSDAEKADWSIELVEASGGAETSVAQPS